MDIITAGAVVLGLVAVATAAGLAWRATNGRVRRVRSAELVREADIGAEAFGRRATLLQFSSEFCAPCTTTARILGSLASERDGVEHVDVDLTHRPELAHRFGILQTPTTLLLDASGAVHARIGGAARPLEVRASLDRILGSTDAAA